MAAKRPSSSGPPADLDAQIRQKQPGMFGEFFGLLRENKKWWLTPVIAVTILLGVLMMLLATPLSPLIYSLF